MGKLSEVNQRALNLNEQLGYIKSGELIVERNLLPLIEEVEEVRNINAEQKSANIMYNSNI